MKSSVRILAFTCLLMLLAYALPARAQADDERKVGTFFEGEVGGVWAAGNSRSNSFTLNATLRHAWPRAEVKLEAGGLRTESALTTRRAVGTGEKNFSLEEVSDLQRTAEAYYARTRYDRQFSSRVFAFGGLDWLRNEFAGVDSRFLLALGAGNSWINTDRIQFKTDYGFTYTFESDVYSNPFIDKATNFPGLRLGYELAYALTSTTGFKSTLVGDWNLNATDDVRLDWLNSITIAISSRLALKPSLRLQWRNDPAFAQVPLFNEDGSPVLGPNGKQASVPAQLKNVDSHFSLALVVNL